MLQIINFIVLFGMVQGFILSLVLFFSKKHFHQKGKYFLGIFLLILIYNGLETLNWSAGWKVIFFSLYTFTVIFGVGPSLYFYVLSFTQPSKITRWKVFKHYLPVFIQFILRSALLVHWFWGNNPTLTLWLDSWQATIAEPLSALFTAIYVGLTWKKLKQFEQNQTNITEEISLLVRWSRQFLIFMTVIVVMWFLSLGAFYCIPEPSYFSFYYPTEMVLVLLIYWIGFTGYHQMYIIRVAAPKPESSLLNDFTEEKIKYYIIRLKDALENEKLYLDNELNVNKLANHLHIPSKTISALLNQHLCKGFNEFVNEYRIKEVKQQLINPANRHLTISAIALEAGFNSQATFQRVFKNQVGMTPREFLNLERKKVKN